ncbi:MAG TPA: LysE family transporter [Candidatus Babeliales bacterium]|nr:LysE family transporter [Candidatus Babeliales bacterium]
MSLLLEGMVVGFSIAAPVGAIGFLCIQQTLRGGISLGIATGLGAATADMMYGILVALGMKATQSFLLAYKVPMTIIGGLFLCYLGIKKFFAVVPVHNGSKPVCDNILKAYIVTFFLTLTNPATILDFTALFAGLSIDISGYLNSLYFVGGVFLGSAIWWLLLSFCVHLFRKRISHTLLRYINYTAGIVIFGFGVYAITQICWVK